MVNGTFGLLFLLLLLLLLIHTFTQTTTQQGAALTPALVRRHCSRENQDEALLLSYSPSATSSSNHTGIVRGPALVVLLEKVVALGPAVLGSGEQILRACGLVLCLAAATRGEEEDGGDGEGDEDGVGEMVEVVLGLLSVLLEVGEETRSAPEETALQALIPLLDGVMATRGGHRQEGGDEKEGGQQGEQPRRRASAQVVEMAATIKALILTRGLSAPERRAAREREARAVAARAGMGLKEVLVAVEEDVRSPMVPLRARGVVTLTRVLHAMPRRGRGKDKGAGIVVVGEEEEEEGEEAVLRAVVALLLEMLADADSFVYLAAVQGLAVLRWVGWVMWILLIPCPDPLTFTHH